DCDGTPLDPSELAQSLHKSAGEVNPTCGGAYSQEANGRQPAALLRPRRERPRRRAAEKRDELAAPHVQHGASFPSVASLVAARATRGHEGWNIDRQKHDWGPRAQITRASRVCAPHPPPLLYSLFVHGRSPSVVNRRTDLRTIRVARNGWAGPWGKPEM